MRLWVITLWVLCAPAWAATYEVRVTSVIDGDTLIVTDGGRKATVRLADIDAPEKGQPYGETSRDALVALVLNKVVRVTPRVTDDYGRVVALVHIGTVNVSETQLHNGMAWENSHHHHNRALKKLENEARRAKRGLWAKGQPVPPWEFRKTQAAVAKPVPAQPSFARTCGNKHLCSQMLSCAEAQFYYTQCGVKTLDKNADGVPCESLCAPARR